MPTLRILADGRWLYASPGQPDYDGFPAFWAGSADTTLLTLDYTAWLGAATIATSAWAATNCTTGTEATSGALATVLVTLPTINIPVIPDPAYPQPAVLRNTLTASDGRVIHITTRLVTQPR